MIPINEEKNGAHTIKSHGARAACGECQHGEGLTFDFEFAFQPIVNVVTRTVYAHEALVRGPAGESAYSVLSQVTPDNQYSFDQACRVKAVKTAAELGMKEFLSINFLPNAVYRPEACIRTTLDAARQYRFPTENIIFEVTEGEKIEERPHLVNIFHEYRRMGFRTAIDDFGAGYAGLNLLAEYQPHIVKIDMDIVRNIDRSVPRQTIVEAVVLMCRKLNMMPLAEGIETKAERDFLLSAGIELMQGYLFCKPAFKALGKVNADAWM